MENYPRLQIISLIDTKWANHIYKFIQEYPEFIPYVYVAPLYKLEPIPYPHISSLFHGIIHYICSAGVRYSYASKQWDYIHTFLNHDSWDTIMNSIYQLSIDKNIQPKKRLIYFNLCQVMNKHNLNHMNITISHLKLLQKEVKGIGPSCVAWCKKYFTMDDDCIEYTDIGFITGFNHLYQTHNIITRKQKIKEWIDKGFGRIANLMVSNIKPNMLPNPKFTGVTLNYIK